MIAAFAVSTAFLVFYLLHKYLQGFHNVTLEAGPVVRAVYLVMLSSHVVLATMAATKANIRGRRRISLGYAPPTLGWFIFR